MSVKRKVTVPRGKSRISRSLCWFAVRFGQFSHVTFQPTVTHFPGSWQEVERSNASEQTALQLDSVLYTK